jgi:hypothetical protein
MFRRDLGGPDAASAAIFVKYLVVASDIFVMSSSERPELEVMKFAWVTLL